MVEDALWCTEGSLGTRGRTRRFPGSQPQPGPDSAPNHMTYINLALTTHFPFCTIEFILREDLITGGSAQSRVAAQISHHDLWSGYLRSNSLRLSSGKVCTTGQCLKLAGG